MLVQKSQDIPATKFQVTFHLLKHCKQLNVLSFYCILTCFCAVHFCAVQFLLLYTCVPIVVSKFSAALLANKVLTWFTWFSTGLEWSVFSLTWPRWRIFWMTMRMEAGSALWRVVFAFKSFRNCRLWVAQPLQFSVSPAGCTRALISYKPHWCTLFTNTYLVQGA